MPLGDKKMSHAKNWKSQLRRTMVQIYVRQRHRGMIGVQAKWLYRQILAVHRQTDDSRTRAIKRLTYEKLPVTKFTKTENPFWVFQRMTLSFNGRASPRCKWPALSSAVVGGTQRASRRTPFYLRRSAKCGHAFRLQLNHVWGRLTLALHPSRSKETAFLTVCGSAIWHLGSLDTFLHKSREARWIEMSSLPSRSSERQVYHSVVTMPICATNQLFLSVPRTSGVTPRRFIWENTTGTGSHNAAKGELGYVYHRRNNHSICTMTCFLSLR